MNFSINIFIASSASMGHGVKLGLNSSPVVTGSAAFVFSLVNRGNYADPTGSLGMWN